MDDNTSVARVREFVSCVTCVEDSDFDLIVILSSSGKFVPAAFSFPVL